MKKNIYKKSFSFLLVITLSVCFSCSDFLEEKLPDRFDADNYFRNVEESVKGLYGLYANVKSVVFGPEYYSVTDVMCDDMDFRGTDQSRRQLGGLTFSESNRYFVNVWAKLYAVVNNANLIIDKVPDAAAPTPTAEDNRKIIIAEAKFIRAWAYFTLVQLWGDVPLVTEPTLSKKDVTFPKRTSVDEIINTLILPDLDSAYVLPEKPLPLVIRGSNDPVQYPVMIGQGAVRLLKAKVYLYQKKYPECIEAIQYIIARYDDNGEKNYALISDYAKLFDVRNKRDKDRLKEVIWEIEADSKTGYNNTNHREFAPGNSANTSESGTTGYQNYMPSTSLFEVFSKQYTDKRYTATYRITNASGYGPCIMKHVDVMTTDQNTGGPNEVLMRVADALLIYAEALNETGETAEAIKWINKIRNRAGLIRQVGPLTTGDIKANTPYNVVADTILHERRIELAHEGQRLFDLRRTGKLMKALQVYNSNVQRYRTVKTITFAVTSEMTGGKETSLNWPVPFVEATKNIDNRILLHPIPTDELRSNPNLLPQNPGYY